MIWRRGAFRIAKTVMTTWAAGSSPVWIFTQIDNPVGQNPGTLLLPYHFKKWNSTAECNEYKYKKQRPSRPSNGWQVFSRWTCGSAWYIYIYTLTFMEKHGEICCCLLNYLADYHSGPHSFNRFTLNSSVSCFVGPLVSPGIQRSISWNSKIETAKIKEQTEKKTQLHKKNNQKTWQISANV